MVSESLTAASIASLVPKLFAIHDYGFVSSDFSPSTSTTKIPATLQIRCWEALEPEKYFTDEQITVLASRRAERVRMRAECVRLLGEMDDIEKLELLKGDKGEKREKGDKGVKRDMGVKGDTGTDGDKGVFLERTERVHEGAEVS